MFTHYPKDPIGRLVRRQQHVPWQFASVVIEEGEKSYTTNVCYNKILVAKGDKPLTKWQWYAVLEKKAHRGML